MGRYLCALLVPACMTCSAAGSVTFGLYNGGDAGFLALTANGTLERAVGEARIGDNLASGTWERAIWEFGGVGTPKATGGFTWTSGISVPFSMSFDGSSTVSFTVGGQTLTWNSVAGSFTDIFLRTRSARSDTGIELSNLTLTGVGALGIDLMSSGANNVDYLRISNTSAFGAVTISGDATLTWSGSPPTGSSLAFQVKFTNVPTPAGGTLLVLAGALGIRRRR